MKKQKIAIFIGIVFIALVALLAVSNFIKSVPSNEETVSIVLQGTWKVYQHGDESVENEYLVFTDSIVQDYRNGDTTPYLESEYQLSDSNKLTLSSVAKEFECKSITENSMILVGSDSVEWKLFRAKMTGDSLTEILPTDLYGSWNVIAHAGSTNVSEVIVFDENNVFDYRDGEKEPSLQLEYALDGRNIISKETSFVAYWSTDSTMILLEGENNYIWELQKIAQ